MHACNERLVRDSLGSRWHNFKTSTSRPVDIPLIGLGPELASRISSLFSSSTNSTHWQLGKLYCLLAACDIVAQPTGGHALKWVACERQIRMPRPKNGLGLWGGGGTCRGPESALPHSLCGRSSRGALVRGGRRRGWASNQAHGGSFAFSERDVSLSEWKVVAAVASTYQS